MQRQKNLIPPRVALVFGLAVLTVWLVGCGEQTPTTPPPAAQKHEDQPPHGGTPVVLGHEDFCLELVLDKPAGIMNAYLLDGEMENFVRIPSESFCSDGQTPGRRSGFGFQGRRQPRHRRNGG